MDRILLSPPDVRGRERERVLGAIDSNWVAPAGPDLDAFETELATVAGRSCCVALASGTAGLHLALETAGVRSSDLVLVPTLTFVATANAIHQVGAQPVFIDSEARSWNVDPNLVNETLTRLGRAGSKPKAVVTVDLFGQCADYTTLETICAAHEVVLIADAAESVGARHGDRPAGSFGESAVFSFNGNKIITAGGGGAFLSDDELLADRVRHLATQAREPAVHYEHIDRGYNYRLSNILAALGRAQLETLKDRVARRRQLNRAYRDALGEFAGVSFMPEAPGNFTTFWLTAIRLDPTVAGLDREGMRLALEAANIESRPVWKPMHLQPAYAGEEAVLNGVSDEIFTEGLCLPSGSGMTDEEVDRVVGTLVTALRDARR